MLAWQLEKCSVGKYFGITMLQKIK